MLKGVKNINQLFKKYISYSCAKTSIPNISATWNCKSITEPFPHEWRIQALGNTTESEYGQCFKPVFLLSKQTEKSRSPGQ